jgi:hypothetical protein
VAAPLWQKIACEPAPRRLLIGQHAQQKAFLSLEMGRGLL